MNKYKKTLTIAFKNRDKIWFRENINKNVKILGGICEEMKKMEIREKSKIAGEKMKIMIKEMPKEYENVTELIKNISENTEKELGDEYIECMFGKYVKYIPGICSIEHLYKCFIYETINICIEKIKKEKDEKMAKEISKIIINKTTNPIEMAIKITEYMIMNEKIEMGELKKYYKIIRILSNMDKK